MRAEEVGPEMGRLSGQPTPAHQLKIINLGDVAHRGRAQRRVTDGDLGPDARSRNRASDGEAAPRLDDHL